MICKFCSADVYSAHEANMLLPPCSCLRSGNTRLRQNFISFRLATFPRGQPIHSALTLVVLSDFVEFGMLHPDFVTLKLGQYILPTEGDTTDFSHSSKAPTDNGGGPGGWEVSQTPDALQKKGKDKHT